VEIKRQIESDDREQEEIPERVAFSEKGLTNDSLKNLGEGFRLLFESEPEKKSQLKMLTLSFNLFDEDGLGVLAENLAGTTLQQLNLGFNDITTLAPLVRAGRLSELFFLGANGCSLEGENAIPVDLCFNLPALSILNLDGNHGTIEMTEEALCELPLDCTVQVYRTTVRVEPRSENEVFLSKNGTVQEILELAGVKTPCKQTNVKRARPRGMGMRCGACSSPRPRFACAACKTEAYCDDRCQKLAWASHKNSCFDS